MSDLVFPVNAVVGTLDGEDATAGAGLVGEVLFFPEAAVLAPRQTRLRVLLTRHVREILGRTGLGEVYRRRRSGEPAVREVTVVIDPPRPPRRGEDGDESPIDAAPPEAWREPVEATFHVVRWLHGERAAVAFVPALGIEVLAADDKELDARLPVHIRAALLRRGAGRSLRELAGFQRLRKVEVHRLEVDVSIKTPKRVAVESEQEPRERPVIEQVGVDLTKQSLPKAWELENTVAALADALTGKHPRSVLLVGKAGVGKTSAVYELARNREAFQLGQTPFWATSGARLVAGMTGFGMWQERCRRLCREAAKARAIVYLGNLIELMEVGRRTHNAQGIASFLRPYVGRGEVLAITECTPEQLAVLEREDPHTLEVFSRLEVEEPKPEVCRTILLNELLAAGAGSAPMEDAALESVDALHRRYATYSAFPARPVRFVRNLLRDRKSQKSTAPITRRDVLGAFARETGLPLMLLDAAVPLDLEKTREWFASRVIGQTEAVELVCDLIATVKAAMGRPRRPIASLLFIGPTGVGKTEMAKALAEFFFGDPGRLARFDMSEFSAPAAVERLVGAGYGSEGLLTARVREQPFSVVLLDEFEKAHPALFDLMLQVLGEGRLTDAAGRVADFGNAVVVMTSNLGAASFRQAPFGLTRPKDGGAGDARLHFVEAVRDHFRPEMYNRIDRVVPFAPLGPDVILRIARRELELVQKRDGVRLRGVELDVNERAIQHLAERGFDVRYGARPLKRRIERELLVPLAEGLNAYAEDTRLVARATEADGKISAVVRAAGEGRPSGPASDLMTAAGQWTELRRKLQKLMRSVAITETQNELYALQRLKERLEAVALARAKAKAEKKGENKAKIFVQPIFDSRLAKLPRLENANQTLASVTTRITDGETATLLAVFGDAEPSPDVWAQLAAVREDWQQLLLTIYSLRFAHPDEVVLAIYGQDLLPMYDVARAYHDLARSVGSDVKIWTYVRRPRDRWKDSEKPEYDRVPLDADKQTPADFFDERRTVAAIALVIEGPHVRARFSGEGGMQSFVSDGKVTGLVGVQVGGGRWDDHALPGDADRPDLWDPKTARRTFDLDKNVAEDAELKEEFRWTGRQWARVLAEAAELWLKRAVESVLGDGGKKGAEE